MDRDRIIREILAERARQDCQFGRDQGQWKAHPSIRLTILQEEVGEVARAIIERKPLELRSELIQCGAVIIAWLEALDLEGRWRIVGIGDGAPDCE